MRRYIQATMTILISTLLLAACGGGGAGTDPATNPGSLPGSYSITYSSGGTESGGAVYTRFASIGYVMVSLQPAGSATIEHTFHFYPPSGSSDDAFSQETFDVRTINDSLYQYQVFIETDETNTYDSPIGDSTTGYDYKSIDGTITVTTASGGSYHATLNDVVMDVDENLSTTDDQITLNGTIEADLAF